MHVLILAGGGGLRLWPLSRQDFPKQFLHLGDEESLLQKTVRRFLDAPFAQTISIATNERYEPLIRQQLSKIGVEIPILVEPLRKNTAPAIAHAVRQLELHFGAVQTDAILAIPSDHLLEPKSIFFHHVAQIEPLLRQGRLILFGIRPAKPETGYGYIQVGAPLEGSVHRVARFVEKPNAVTAKAYCASGDYYWNSGMFACSIEQLWKEFQTHAPEIYHQVHDPSQYSQMPEISFDFAILEKSSSIAVCLLPVTWSDIGSWDSVYDCLNKDTNLNVKIGNILDYDTKNSLIIGGKKLISTIGLDDLLIVETDDATFISKKGESQKVKELVQELIRKGRREGESSSQVRCPWGKRETLCIEPTYLVERLTITSSGPFVYQSQHPEQWISMTQSLSIDGTTLSFGASLQLSPQKPVTVSADLSSAALVVTALANR